MAIEPLCVRYFRQPLRGPPTHRVPNSPSNKKRKFKNPHNLQEYPKVTLSPPKVNAISPKVSVISRKVKVISPKVNIQYFCREFLKSLKFLKFPVGGGGSRSHGISQISEPCVRKLQNGWCRRGRSETPHFL